MVRAWRTKLPLVLWSLGLMGAAAICVMDGPPDGQDTQRLEVPSLVPRRLEPPGVAPRPLVLPTEARPVAPAIEFAVLPRGVDGQPKSSELEQRLVAPASGNDVPGRDVAVPLPQQGPFSSSPFLPQQVRRLPPPEPDEPTLAPLPQPATKSVYGAPPSTNIPDQPENELAGQRPSTSPPPGSAAMRPVAQRAAEMNRQAELLARRGAMYVARNEAIQALRVIAEALDQEQPGSGHATALSNALTALREAEDFVPRQQALESRIALATIVAAHRTRVLENGTLENVTPVTALQKYYGYAQSQLVRAAGKQPVASYSLYLLGKLQLRLVSTGGTAQEQTQLARGMVFHQAALDVDPRNYMAANELGVLLVRFGQYPDARRVLLWSVQTKSHADGWHNLAVVHDRLGEKELAAKARTQAKQLESQAPALAVRPSVQWVDPEVFARTGPTPGNVSPAAAQKTISLDARQTNSQRQR